MELVQLGTFANSTKTTSDITSILNNHLVASLFLNIILGFVIGVVLMRKEDALEHLSIAKTILLDFEKETGYSHPLLKDVENRILELEQVKNY